ncbi:hypothetical protein [Lentibacter sp. XHP0401]|jgi:hypothetical protein|uniref:hypothetical protein n=1 Tax=Lentibacter sp. XHP0401 TaxID=2984334 RepID=UPI0021E95879|nr:hypothetical protein [Lentibacter sp. XHP0401]MCV2893479.1 hypothetical protein [Lentibacter sp. XHP0401]
MKTVAKFAAIALIAAPTFAAAGSKGTAVMESDVFVDTTPVAGGSSGSMGSMGTGAAIAAAAVVVLAIAASDGS